MSEALMHATVFLAGMLAGLVMSIGFLKSAEGEERRRRRNAERTIVQLRRRLERLGRP